MIRLSNEKDWQIDNPNIFHLVDTTLAVDQQGQLFITQDN
jgi:hypothetical protein